MICAALVSAVNKTSLSSSFSLLINSALLNQNKVLFNFILIISFMNILFFFCVVRYNYLIVFHQIHPHTYHTYDSICNGSNG